MTTQQLMCILTPEELTARQKAHLEALDEFDRRELAKAASARHHKAECELADARARELRQVVATGKELRDVDVREARDDKNREWYQFRLDTFEETARWPFSQADMQGTLPLTANLPIGGPSAVDERIRAADGTPLADAPAPPCGQHTTTGGVLAYVQSRADQAASSADVAYRFGIKATKASSLLSQLKAAGQLHMAGKLRFSRYGITAEAAEARSLADRNSNGVAAPEGATV